MQSWRDHGDALPFCTSRLSAPDCRTLCTRALRYCPSGRPPARSGALRAASAVLCVPIGTANTNINTFGFFLVLVCLCWPTHNTNGYLTQYLDGVHLVAGLLVANLADIVAGILRPDAANLQIVIADDLETFVARDFQVSRGQNGGTATP